MIYAIDDSDNRIAELGHLSYSITREMAPIYSMGHIVPRTSFTRGIAGSFTLKNCSIASPIEPFTILAYLPSKPRDFLIKITKVTILNTEVGVPDMQYTFIAAELHNLPLSFHMTFDFILNMVGENPIVN